MRRIARLCVFVTLTAHLLALMLTGSDAASSPISQLSRGDAGWLHSAGLLSLAVSWVIIALRGWRLDSGALWRGGCSLLFLSAALLPYVAYYFATASDATLFGRDANDPLALLASLLGVAMAALQPGLRRQHPGLAAINLVVLLLWLGLIPVIPFIEPHWLGAYERCVGILMLFWTYALTAVVPSVAGEPVRGG